MLSKNFFFKEMETQRLLPYYDFLINEIKKQNPAIIGVLIALLVIFITTLLFCLFQRSKSSKKTLLLIGLSESGKTLLLSRLVHKRYVATHTSIQENSGVYYSSNGKSITIIDLPGHERLRTQIWDKYKNNARGIIFVIDSLNFPKDLKDIAELLYSILTDKVVFNNSHKILIACNKQDITLSKSAKVIQSQLEKEINTVRMTRSAALESTDSSSNNNNTFLGKHGQDFQFSHLSPLKIEFVECYSKDMQTEEHKADLLQIDKWIEKSM